MMGAGVLLLLLAPLLWIAVRAFDRRRGARLEALVGPRVGVLAPGRSETRRGWRRGVFALALLLATIAALGPESRTSNGDTAWRGVDLVLCLDVSRSMLARDLDPDRLTRAKQEILSLAGAAQGDRLALVVFAGDARLRVPLTQDVLSFAGLTARVDPSDARRGGTNLGAALETAAAALPATSRRYGTIVLLTDGEDLAGGGLRVAEDLAAQGRVVHCLGLGSTLGSKITIREAGASGFLRDKEGQDVVSALDAAGLRSIAEATGGAYADARTEPDALARLYTERILPAAHASIDTHGSEEERFPYRPLLLAAFLLWVLALVLSDRRRA